MKFEMPQTPEGQIAMHDAMLLRVRFVLQDVAARQEALLQELKQITLAGQDTRNIHQARKNLHLQELCLRGQERRLQERIASLQTGNSIFA